VGGTDNIIIGSSSATTSGILGGSENSISNVIQGHGHHGIIGGHDNDIVDGE